MSRRRRLPATIRPVPAVVLGLDTAKRSGAAIVCRREDWQRVCDEQARAVGVAPDYSGESSDPLKVLSAESLGDRPEDIMAVVRSAQLQARTIGLPLIVVHETPAGDTRQRNKFGSRVPMYAGLGAAWGAWRTCLRLAEHPDSRMLSVTTGEWRARVYGHSRMSTETAKLYAQSLCRARWSLELDADAAEAVCIAVWAFHSGHVAERIPKRVARAHGLGA